MNRVVDTLRGGDPRAPVSVPFVATRPRGPRPAKETPLRPPDPLGPSSPRRSLRPVESSTAPSRPDVPGSAGPLAARRPRSHLDAARTVVVEIDLGPLAPALADPDATDVFLNPDGRIWVDRGGGAEPAPGVVVPPEAARDLAVRLIAAGGRHVDEATPCVDVRLPRGIRAHVVLPPVSTSGAVVSLRIPRRDPLSLEDLLASGTVDATTRDALAGLVRSRANLLISGAGGSGKTTLLAALLAGAEESERIVVVEDVAELQIDHPQVIVLEARQANIEGAGEIGLDRLVREALRMRPDRLVVGECRGPELRELLSALNTGHDGGAGTLHANSLDDVPARLEALGALAGLDATAVARQAVSAVDAVLHLERTAAGRRLVGIGRLAIESGRLRVVGE